MIIHDIPDDEDTQPMEPIPEEDVNAFPSEFERRILVQWGFKHVLTGYDTPTTNTGFVPHLSEDE